MFNFELRTPFHSTRVGHGYGRLGVLLCLLGSFIPGVARAAEIGTWPFSEGTGSVTADISGHQHDGQLQSTAWASGFDGGGLDFSDSAAVVIVASSPVLESPAALSFAAWVRQAPGGDFSSIVDKRDSGADGYDLYLDHQGRVFVRINSLTLAGVTSVADGGWHHVAGVWDGASISLYVDGSLDRSSGVPSTLLDVVAPLRLGGHFQGSAQFGFKGTLDEVRIFDSALTAVQVQALYDAGAQDVFPPVLSNAEPVGVLPAGTTQALLGLDSDESATCRWSDTAGTDFSSMSGFFSQTGGLRHETMLSGFADGVSYAFYVRCEDASGNANPSDLAVTFSVADPSPGSDAVGHWLFDEGVGSVAADSSGNGHDGTLVNSPTWETGHDGFGLAFRNADDYVDLGASPALTQLAELSVAAWVRHPDTTEFTSIVDARDSGGDGYDLYFSNSGRGFVRINNATLSGVTIAADDQWHHLATTWDGGTLSLYVDGVLDASRAAAEAAIDVASNVLIGRHFDGDARFENNGVLDDVRIYDRALSAAEIQQLADPGSGGSDSTPPIRSNAAPSVVLPSGTTDATVSLVTDEPAECRWSGVAGSSFGGMTEVFATTGGTAHAEPVTGLTDGESRSYFVRCSDSLGNANTDDLEVVVAVAEPAPPPSGPIGYWPFSEGGGTSTLDASGNGHHGALVNQPSWSDGWQGAGLSFPGAEDGVMIGSAPELSDLDALSISVWIRQPEPVDFSSIVDQRDQVADGYDLYLDPTGRAFFRVNSSTLVGTTSVADSQWHHLAAVWDGAGMSIFVDGALQASQSIGGTSIQTSAPLWVGLHFEDDARFQSDGTVDELRLYDRALSSAEVLALATPSGSHVALAPGFPDKHVVQRVGASADLPLAGSYSGSPTAIEARLVETATGLAVIGLDWTVVDPAPSGGSWSGSLVGVPEGGWYRLELRFADDPGVTLSSPARLGVGMVIAALGQSSMAKLFTEIAFAGDGDLGVASLDAPDALTGRLGYGNPRRSATDLGGYLRTESIPGRVSRGAVTGAGAVRMANQLVAELQIPVLVLDFAIDGTSILSWTDETWARRQVFDSALASVGGDFELMLWFQGGYDILDDMPAATYQAGLDLFYSQIQDLLPAQRALEMLVAIQGRGDYPQPHDEAYREIRAVQFDWAEQDANVHHAGSAIDLHLAASSFSRGDGHYTASQMQILADRYTRAILDLIDHVGSGGGAGGGRIESAVQIGSEVRVGVAHDQGSALTVPDPGADIEGFELSDDGFQTVWRLGAGISSATLSADQQEVVLTLEQTVTGLLELRYLYGMNAFRHKATESERRRNGNTIFDDFAYHPDRVGLPINPTGQAIDVSPVP